MKTVPFSDILNQTCQLIGLDVTTLNDKSFSAIRDLTSRRISQVWDREEWPDVERSMRTFPGNPVTSVLVEAQDLTTEDDQALLCENDVVIWTENSEGTIPLFVYLDEDFPKIYLSGFVNDAYRRDTITETNVSFLNPFYLLLPDGTRQSVASVPYKFTYISRTGESEYGPYIHAIKINIPYSIPEYSAANTQSNNALTTTVVFESNQQLLIQLRDSSLQGLQVFNSDPRTTTRCTPQKFIVEDLPNRDDQAFDGSVWNEEYSYLRVFDSGQKFVGYRIPSIRLLGSKYSQSTVYQSGAQVYYGENFFVSLSEVPAGVVPAYVSQYWKVIQIPYRFRDFLVNGVSCDFLRSEGRADEANILDGLAENSIQQQIDVLIRQQGQVRKFDMVYTY